MPLTKAQEKVVKDGCSACADWRSACAQLRAMGYPDEAMEERCRAAEQTYKAAGMITDEFNRTQGGTGSESQ